MMVVHFKAIEDTLLSMEERYGLGLTEGTESFLMSVCNRILKDKRIDVHDPSRLEVPFQNEIFTDACKEEFSVYQNGELERECQKRNIFFLEEADRTFQTIRKQLDREMPEREIEERYRPDLIFNMTRYQADLPREELIRQGQWRFLQMALRGWDSDEEGWLYLTGRMFLRYAPLENAPENAFYYIIDTIGEEWSCSDYGRRIFVRAEIYDAVFREIFEAYGKVNFLCGKYVLKIKGDQAYKELPKEVKRREGEAMILSRKIQYPDARKAYYSMMEECFSEVGSIFYRTKQETQKGISETDGLIVYGPYCISEEDPDEWCPVEEEQIEDSEEGITYKEYVELISRIEEEYSLTLRRGDEDEHMEALEKEHKLHLFNKSFMETVWCHAMMLTPIEMREPQGPLDKKRVLEAVRMIYPSYEDGKLEEMCEEEGIMLPGVIQNMLIIEEPPMTGLYVNHEELIQNGKERVKQEIKDWGGMDSADLEAMMFLANYALISTASMDWDFPNEGMNYYVMEPILYQRHDPYQNAGHRLYLLDCTYDALMREIFEEALGYRMGGKKYHLTITDREMEFLTEKRIKKEIRGAEYFCNDPECDKEESAWYRTVRQIWIKFLDFVQTVYRDYGAVRPELALYGPYDLREEGIPPTYREFLLDCLQ